MSRPAIDLSGQRFGRLLVLERVRVCRRWAWRCDCVCGSTALVSLDSLRHGQQSCGCLRSESIRARNINGETWRARRAKPMTDFDRALDERIEMNR